MKNLKHYIDFYNVEYSNYYDMRSISGTESYWLKHLEATVFYEYKNKIYFRIGFNHFLIDSDDKMLLVLKFIDLHYKGY